MLWCDSSSSQWLGRTLISILLLLHPLTIPAHLLHIQNIEPAATQVPPTIAASAPLQPAERTQLTQQVLNRISTDPRTSPYASYFSFRARSTTETNTNAKRQSTAPCKSFPGDPEYPPPDLWNTFNALLDNALIQTVPLAAPCYDSQWGPRDAQKCARIMANYTNSLLHEEDPTSTMWPIFQGRTCTPRNDTSTSNASCTLGAYPTYAVNVSTIAQIQLAVNFAREANLRLVIKNTGHCYLGKSAGAGALSLWMHNMKSVDFLPEYMGSGYEGPALKIAAGVTVREVYEAADKNGVTVVGAIGWSVGFAGGMITGGGQNPLAGIYGMAADHVIAFQVVTANVTVSKDLQPDLFWALRGGGGGTFAVVTSVIVRAYPKLNVITDSWQLDASTNSAEAFWKATKKFYDLFLDWADAGLYTFYFHGATPAPFLNMRIVFAPNHTLDSYNQLVQPFFDFIDANNITLSSPRKPIAHTTFYSAYQATWGGNTFPIGLDTSLPANRIVPRRNFKEKYNETWALLKEHISSGKHFLGYHKRPASYGDIDNAVNPAWRECVLFFVTSSNRTRDHSTAEALARENADLHGNILQPWRDITPVSEGGGTYLNEASVMEPDWQESFYGGLYPRLSGIKKTWDPDDVFYATTAVGSERWEVRDGEQGVQTQNGRLCRVA